MERKRRSSVKGRFVLDVATYTRIAVEEFLRDDPMRASDAEIKRAVAAARGAGGKKAACAKEMRHFPPALRRRLKCSAKFLRLTTQNLLLFFAKNSPTLCLFVNPF